ncbi:MAG: phosphoribosylaminoimidazolesuccinocarboxamide synthase [Candidatus Sumerlaeia bacterium]|nr:phosphoribosylaminoimidazolesuccinocarboxamide synthase [Candidatus Sumerlaeia bacterium]
MGIERTLVQSALPGRAAARGGKVRELYDFGDAWLMIASDRLSAFDVVFPTPVPGKGRVLTALTVYWMQVLRDVVGNHLLGAPDANFLEAIGADPALYSGRSLLVKKADPFPVECVVRGYLEGSAWAEYSAAGTVGGHPMPAGLRLHDELPEPLFTPATKAESGHDENIPYERMESIIGAEAADFLRRKSLELYRGARAHLAESGITLADTKFEFGRREGSIILIDEALTPDSSRFLVPGPDGAPVSMDKQFVRDWCLASGWNRQPPAPALPDDVVRQTSQRYLDIARRILGKELDP